MQDFDNNTADSPVVYGLQTNQIAHTYTYIHTYTRIYTWKILAMIQLTLQLSVDCTPTKKHIHIHTYKYTFIHIYVYLEDFGSDTANTPVLDSLHTNK